jgi:flagellin
MASFNNAPLSMSASIWLDRASNRVSKSLERLASGQRINRASDDAAGLAIASRLEADQRIAGIAMRNISDGISYLSTAGSSLEEISSILARMSELASQSASGVYTVAQRTALAAEFVALGSEIERIAAATEFNSVKLLSNSASISVQAGIRGDANSSVFLQSVLGTLQSMSLGNATGALTYSIMGTTVAYSQSAAQAALNAVNTAIDTVASARGVLGASESRLSFALNNLSSARENYTLAASQIRDVDVAAETAELTRNSIIQQSATAMAAQANLSAQIILRLLG